MIDVDPNTLGETSKALLWVIGALLAGGGGYIVGMKRTVKLDPNRVEVAPDSCTQFRTNLEKRVSENAKTVSILSLRMTSTEKDVAELKGQIPYINQGICRIENKLDDLMGKVRQ